MSESNLREVGNIRAVHITFKSKLFMNQPHNRKVTRFEI